MSAFKKPSGNLAMVLAAGLVVWITFLFSNLSRGGLPQSEARPEQQVVKEVNADRSKEMPTIAFKVVKEVLKEYSPVLILLIIGFLILIVYKKYYKNEISIGEISKHALIDSVVKAIIIIATFILYILCAALSG